MPARRFEGRGPSQRQLKVWEVLRRALSDVLRRGDIHDPELDRFSLTVGEARMSPDLRVATVFVLPLGGMGAEGALEALERNKGELRRAVSKEIQLKFAPDLRFRLDDSFDRMDETRRLLDVERVRRDVEDGGGPDGEDPDGDAPNRSGPEAGA